MKTPQDHTTIYGASDDLIEVDGGKASGEVGCYGTDENDHPGVLMVCSDGTILTVKYGKGEQGIWGVQLIKRGTQFNRIDQCDHEDARIHSDICHFDGFLEWAYAAKKWEKVS